MILSGSTRLGKIPRFKTKVGHSIGRGGHRIGRVGHRIGRGGHRIGGYIPILMERNK